MKLLPKLGALLIPIILLQGCSRVYIDATPSPEAPSTSEQPPLGELPIDEEPNVGDTIDRATLQFVGDIFLHERPMEVARIGDATYDFRPWLTHIRPYVIGDLAIANMEVPVDARGNNQGLSGWPLFNSPFEILEAIKYAGFNHLISANNHSFDMGFEGLLNTVNSFNRAGISHTGMSVDLEDFNTPTLIDVNGIKVGIIAYADSVNGLEWMVPESERAFAVRRFRSHTLDDIPNMVNDMNDLREAGAELVIVALHWGAEYVDYPTNMQRLIAQQLSEAGADVIMGKHSHSPQPVEWHTREDGSRSLIMYSLGNFLADQTRLTGPSVQQQLNDPQAFGGRTQFGMLVTLEVSRDEEGAVVLDTANVLPTLTMRDFSGDTLGQVDGVTVLPLFDGELPDFVEDSELRYWGQRAYDHVTRIVDREFIR